MSVLLTVAFFKLLSWWGVFVLIVRGRFGEHSFIGTLRI